MTQFKQPAIAVIGGNVSINYLIERYAERMGYSITDMPVAVSAETICETEPVAVIFSSVENLEDSQKTAAGLANCDVPIIVCSSTTDQIRTRELGADYCLLHPFSYDNFSAILEAVMAQAKPINRG